MAQSCKIELIWWHQDRKGTYFGYEPSWSKNILNLPTLSGSEHRLITQMVADNFLERIIEICHQKCCEVERQ